ncbi:NYN domain-containing protein [Psychrobacter sp. PP-21]|uniref:NYN domain-containing protein n=1 Tax=Psychrobacter sp. PP-21 TaxID=2957503 RepID=UPI0029A96307|nr:NYN domain-containing protein [Psychrobacter sp. PP-21]MDX2373186.1 NYN domain-containing protein [Psychrobacter sp. PP-21]
MKLKSIAVLIDADNASANNINYILHKIEGIGHIACKKIYGDWGNVHIQGWQEALLKHAIDPIQHFAYAKGKNTTDIGLVIEAMDLLHSRHYDGFCLVSSDSDFTALALRIRKNGIKVFGFGKQQTVKAFTQACDNFYYVEDLVTLPKTLPISENKDAPSLDIKTKPLLPITESKTSPEKWTTKALQKQTHLISVLNKLIKEDPNSAKGWSNLSYLASQIKQHHTNIKLDRYGYAKFSELIIAMALYDIRTVNKVISIKLKNYALPTSSVAPNDNATSVWDERRLKCDTKLLNSLRASIIDHPNADSERWVNFGIVGNAMKTHYSTLDPKSYGYTRLSDMIKNIRIFETKTVNSTLYVRHKAK